MSSDPIIQFPFNGQSWNAYSYLLNNPMSGTDPSGFTLDCELGDPDCGDGSGDPTRRKPKRFINGRAVCQTVFCSIEGFLALLGSYSDHLEPEDNEGGVGRNGLGNVLVSDIGGPVSDLPQTVFVSAPGGPLIRPNPLAQGIARGLDTTGRTFGNLSRLNRIAQQQESIQQALQGLQ